MPVQKLKQFLDDNRVKYVAIRHSPAFTAQEIAPQATMDADVVFQNGQARVKIKYNNMILKFAHLSNKHISSAYPILDAMLPGKHRLAATFMKGKWSGIA